MGGAASKATPPPRLGGAAGVAMAKMVRNRSSMSLAAQEKKYEPEEDAMAAYSLDAPMGRLVRSRSQDVARATPPAPLAPRVEEGVDVKIPSELLSWEIDGASQGGVVDLRPASPASTPPPTPPPQSPLSPLMAGTSVAILGSPNKMTPLDGPFDTSLPNGWARGRRSGPGRRRSTSTAGLLTPPTSDVAATPLRPASMASDQWDRDSSSSQHSRLCPPTICVTFEHEEPALLGALGSLTAGSILRRRASPPPSTLGSPGSALALCRQESSPLGLDLARESSSEVEALLTTSSSLCEAEASSQVAEYMAATSPTSPALAPVTVSPMARGFPLAARKHAPLKPLHNGSPPVSPSALVEKKLRLASDRGALVSPTPHLGTPVRRASSSSTSVSPRALKRVGQTDLDALLFAIEEETDPKTA
eukprot:TRINITY_DN1311_c1_g1_i1.p1 TRINITY_DN1311_c1_g1~~TRINITY_DN1311_c1_g1_i1.p1  ORF type:complete len:419 (+),score=101.48 TRINITY_DN1311_c1_g1_i1:36-1292(+)